MQTSGPKSASGDSSRRRDQIELDRLDLSDASLSGVKLDGDLTGANLISANLSGATPPGYKDIWDPLFRVFDAFGLDRCMWGTDWTRAVKLLTYYKQGADAFRVTDRLSDSDRATLMVETLSRAYNWSPSKA